MAKSCSCFSFSFLPLLFWCILLVSSGSSRVLSQTKKKFLSTNSSEGNESGKACSNGCSLTVNASAAVKFTNLIDKQKALAIFIFVKVGNTTGLARKNLENYKNGDKTNISTSQVQVVQKWAWLRNQRGKFLATLPYDFDILSLTTLKRDAYSIHINITATPSTCYTNLTEDCLHGLIAKTIVEELTGTLGDVCVRTVETEGQEKRPVKNGGYLCCERRNNSMFRCDVLFENNRWIEIALRFLWASSIGFGIFAPLLFKYLPKEFKKGPRVKARAVFSRHESEISEADTSSLDVVTTTRPRQVLLALDGGTMDILRTQTESIFISRLCRCLFVISLSCLPLLQGFIYAYLKKSEVGISTGKLLGVGDAFITMIEANGQFALSLSYCFCIGLVCVAFSIPRTLSEFARRISGRKDERTFLGFRKPDEIVSSSDQRGFQLCYENMVFHLNCVLKVQFWKFAFFVITYPLQKLFGVDWLDDDANFHNEALESEDSSDICSKICRGVLLLLLFPMWAITLSTAFLLYIFPVTYVAFRIWKMLFRVEIESQCCQKIPSFVKITSFPILYILFIIFCICVEASYFMLVVTFTINIMFLGSVAGFTIMGLLFYINVYLPYIVLGAWVLIYTLRGVNKYYAQFTRLKAIVFEECEKFDNDTKAEANIRETFSGPILPERRSPSTSSLARSKSVNFLVTIDDYGVPSIPLDIFLASSGQLMPFKRIMLAKLLKIIALGSYLVVIFLFVRSLIEFQAASSVVQGLALLLLGGLPLLAFQSQVQVSEAEEIRSRFYVKEYIKQYTKRAL